MPFIKRKVSVASMHYLTQQLRECELNQFQASAVLAFEEAFERLVKKRDAIDNLRSSFGAQPLQKGKRLDDAEQKLLYEKTEEFVQSFYTALSQLSSVVVRFSDVFGRIMFDNQAKFVKWVSSVSGVENPEMFEDLNQARLFRAILDHPEQHPPYTWATQDSPDNILFHVLLHGPASRNGVIPTGATRDHYSPIDDWHFAARDEVSLTNNLGMSALECFAKIYDVKVQGRAFRREVMGTRERFGAETAALATRIR